MIWILILGQFISAILIVYAEINYALVFLLLTNILFACILKYFENDLKKGLKEVGK